MFRCRLRVDDEWYTPDDAWRCIEGLVPKGSRVWEPFYGDGRSTCAMKRMGYDVVECSPDFFESERKADIVITNPPFSKITSIVERLCKLQCKFILIVPFHRLASEPLRRALIGHDVGVVMPRERIDYIKPGRSDGRCPFYSVFLCVGFDCGVVIQ